jgi:hypothetical protein
VLWEKRLNASAFAAQVLQREWRLMAHAAEEMHIYGGAVCK